MVSLGHWERVKGTLPDGRDVMRQGVLKGYVRDTAASRDAYARMTAETRRELES